MAGASNEYADPTRLAGFVRWSLIAMIVVDIAAAVSGGMQYGLLAHIQGGAFPGMKQAARENDFRQLIAGVVHIVTFVGSGILVLRWIWRANKNLHALSPVPLEYTPGWAVGWYFVPFASLWKPFQVMREIWKVSLDVEGSGLLPLWWTFWILSNLAGNATFQLASSRGIDMLMASSIAGIVHDVCNIGAAIILIQTVAKVTEAQRRLPMVSETFS
jgi:hypothetical protein